MVHMGGIEGMCRRATQLIMRLSLRVSENSGYLFGVPIIYNMLGSILGSPVLETYHVEKHL